MPDIVMGVELNLRTIFNLSTPLETWEWHALWSKVGTYLGSQGVHAFLFEITPDMTSAHLRTSNEFAQWFDDDITMLIGDVCPGCDVDIDMFYEDHSPASSDYEEGPYWQY